jgi:UDP-apiose/xylose synthase
MRRIALLGCGGFIGSHLLGGILRRTQAEVLGWDLDAHRIRAHLDDPRFSFFEGDLYADPRLEEKLAQCDVIISLAAICWPSRYSAEGTAVIESNFMQPARLVEIAARLGIWLIHFSTSEIYGKTLGGALGLEGVSGNEGHPEWTLLREEDSPFVLGPVHRSRWSYACAKQLLERWIFSQHQEHGLRYTIVRPFNFIGPGMDFLPGFEPGEGTPRVLACFLAALLQGEPLKLVEGGGARRTFLYIDDVVDAMLRMLERPGKAQNQIFNLGHPGNEVTIRQLAFEMREVFAAVSGEENYRDHPCVEVPAAEFYGEGYDDSDRRLPDIRKARDLLGWEPRVPLSGALSRIAAFVWEAHGRPALREFSI